MSTFPEMLARYMQARGLSLRAFATAAGAGHPNVHAVLHGLRKPPLPAVERWADALGLKGEEREHFITMAVLEHGPRSARDYVERLRALAERKRTR